jgi:hypothetical protein
LGSVFPGGWLLLFFCIGIFESRRQFGKAMKGLECRLVSRTPLVYGER